MAYAGAHTDRSCRASVNDDAFLECEMLALGFLSLSSDERGHYETLAGVLVGIFGLSRSLRCRIKPTRGTPAINVAQRAGSGTGRFWLNSIVTPEPAAGL